MIYRFFRFFLLILLFSAMAEAMRKNGNVVKNSIIPWNPVNPPSPEPLVNTPFCDIAEFNTPFWKPLVTMDFALLKNRGLFQSMTDMISQMVNEELPSKYPRELLANAFESATIHINHIKFALNTPCGISGGVLDEQNTIVIYANVKTTMPELRKILENEAFHMIVRAANVAKMGKDMSTLPHLSLELRQRLFYPFINEKGEISQSLLTKYIKALQAAEDRLKVLPLILKRPLEKLTPEQALLLSRVKKYIDTYEPIVNFTEIYPAEAVKDKDLGYHNVEYIKVDSRGEQLCSKYSFGGKTLEDRIAALILDWKNNEIALSQEIYKSKGPYSRASEKGSDLYMTLSTELLQILAPEFIEYMEAYYKTTKLAPSLQQSTYHFRA